MTEDVKNVSVAGSVDSTHYTTEELKSEWAHGTRPLKLTIRQKSTEDGSYSVNKRTYHFAETEPKPRKEIPKPIELPDDTVPVQSKETDHSKVVQATPEKVSKVVSTTPIVEPEPVVEPKPVVIEKLPDDFPTVPEPTVDPDDISNDPEPVAEEPKEEYKEPIVQEEKNPLPKPTYVTDPKTQEPTVKSKKAALELEVEADIAHNIYSGVCSVVGFMIDEAKDHINELDAGEYTLNITLEKHNEEN